MSQGPESQASPSPAPAPTAEEISTPQTPVPTRNPAAPIFSNAIYMIVGGLLAAGGYSLARVYAPPRPPGEVTGPAAAGARPEDLKSLADRVDDLKRQADENAKKVASIPGPDPDFNKLRDQVSDLARSVEAVPPRFNIVEKEIEAAKAQAVATSPRIDALDRRLTDLAMSVEALKSGADAHAGAPANASAPPARTDDRTIEQAVSLFKAGKYAEAEAAFRRLQTASPDDARVWYYSALARGLATRDWVGETERFVTAGLEREKAGNPPTPQVDAAFDGLTPATGKDWLAAYRKRINAR